MYSKLRIRPILRNWPKDMTAAQPKINLRDADRAAVEQLGTRRHHLVVVHPCYIDAMLAGRKRVECRLSRLRKPPVEEVAPGDLLWLKPPSRPIRALAVAGECHYSSLEGGQTLASVVAPFRKAIAVDEAFFRDAESWARFVSLIELTQVMALAPMRVLKRDQRAWVVLDGPVRPGMRIESKRGHV